MGTESNLNLTHSPYGEQHPYEPLPVERSPRDPQPGQPVTLGVETTPAGAALEVWCHWRLNGSAASQLAEGKPRPGGEGGDLWQVRLPAFSGGEQVRYSLHARSADGQAQTSAYSFIVPTWAALSTILRLEAGDGGARAVLGAPGGAVQALLTLAADGRGGLGLELRCEPGAGQARQQPGMSETRVPLGGFSLCTGGQTPGLTLIRESDGLCLEMPALEALAWPDGRITQARLNFASPADEAFYGFGERFNAHDQRGQRLDNHIYAQYTGQGKRSYLPVPFFLSSRGYGLWLRTERQAWFDLDSGQSGRWSLTAETTADAGLSLRLFLQDHPREIVRAFTDQTGKPALPPDWAFGLWMSSNDWNSQAEVARQLTLADQHRIPATVLVLEAWSDEINFYTWNDSRYALKPAGQPYRLEDFTFPAEGRWPDPRGMADWLHQAGMRLVLWQIPVLKKPNPREALDDRQALADQDWAIRQGFVVRRADGSPHRIEAHSPWFAGSLVMDFTHPEGADWWLDKRRYLVEQMGVDGFKTDGGEHVWDRAALFANGKTGADGINPYPLAYLGAYKRLLNETRGQDAVLFSRAGYTGVQQLSAHWAGDELSTWEAFRASLRALLNVGICGTAFMGWDIAGFAGEVPGSELYLRAAAFSVFCPIMQYHSDTNNRQVPSRDRTPWNIQERSGDEQVIPAFRFLANLRMNLLPYLLWQARESSRSGLPLMRAMAVEFPEEPELRAYPYQYLFGEALLVAPVAEEGRSTWPVYLPTGQWRDFWSGELLEGGREIRPAVPRERIPVYIRRGSILPLNLGEDLAWGSPVGNRVDQIERLALLVFPGETTHCDVFQGGGLAWARAEAVQRGEERVIQLRGLKCPVELLVLGARPGEVTINGRRLAAADWDWLAERRAARIPVEPEDQITVVLLS